ncbi:MAG: hypothetical protein AB8B83_06260 [Bdellovibrionales bacterium]
MSLGDTLASSFAIAATIELGLHIVIHYTVPGAAAAAWLAQAIAPALDAVGLTSSFSAASAASAAEATTAAATAASEQVVASAAETVTNVESLPSLMELAQG